MIKRKYIVLLALTFLICLLFVEGCVSPTADNPFGIKDPNEVREWLGITTTMGEGTAAAGAATGNPYLLAWGGGLVAVGGVLTKILFGKAKNNGNTES